MKITYILPYDWGGMPHYTAELANAVSEYADVTVMGSKRINESYFSKDVKILKIFDALNFSMNHINKAFSFRSVIGLVSFKKIKVIDEIRPDIIHFPTVLMPPLPLFISLYRLDKKYPIILTKHGIFSNSGFKTKILEETTVNLFERLIKFDKIIVHTQNDKDALLKIKRGYEEKVVVIPHGAYSFFKSYGEEVSADKNCILFFGNIRDYKGLKYLIEAVPFISQEVSEFKVIIAGEGDLSRYPDLINDESRFEIHNDFIPDEQVPELFQRAELVVLPYSQMSGQSGIINIAYAFGKPVVASDVGGIHEVLENGITGYLVSPRDSKALADAIIKILKDDELIKKMGENAYKKAQELSWDNIAKRHIEAYKEVMGK